MLSSIRVSSDGIGMKGCSAGYNGSHLQLVNARGIVTLRGSTCGSCDGSGNGSCAQNPWEPAGTRSNQLRELKSIFSAFFRILFAFLENFQYFLYKIDTCECCSVF